MEGNDLQHDELWGTEKDDNNRDFQVVRYIASQSPDIACLQETLYATEDNRQCVESSMKRYGYHLEQVKVGTGALALASRFPIVRTQRICHSAGNGAAAFFVVPQRGDTVIVICVHLESMHLSNGERSTYHELVRNPEKPITYTANYPLCEKLPTEVSSVLCKPTLWPTSSIVLLVSPSFSWATSTIHLSPTLITKFVLG